jgi:hypothetical protein
MIETIQNGVQQANLTPRSAATGRRRRVQGAPLVSDLQFEN